jgi:hydrogenase maturation protease
MELLNWVRVVDYGIRGMHLAYDIAGADYELTVLVDATGRGDDPGTVYLVELDPASLPPASVVDAHGMQPDVMLGMVRMLGADAGRVLLVGCEPATLDERMGLSPPVAAAVDTAVGMVLDVISKHGPGGKE